MEPCPPQPHSLAPAPPTETPAIGLAPRQLAWQVLLAVGAGAYADLALERELQRHPLEGADRALATELAYGAIRQRRLLDAWLDALGKVPAAQVALAAAPGALPAAVQQQGAGLCGGEHHRGAGKTGRTRPAGAGGQWPT